MSHKNVDDYLQDGIYGTKLPKQGERNRFLGTLRERILFCLTIGEVMRYKGREELENFFKSNPDAKLYINGTIGYQFVKDVRKLASDYQISYTSITNEEIDTDIGVVLAYDYAINQEKIFLDEITEIESTHSETTESTKNTSFFKKITNFFKK